MRKTVCTSIIVQIIFLVSLMRDPLVFWVISWWRG